MSIWEPTPETPRVNFSECEILVEPQTASSGNSYHKITINLMPLNGGELVSDTYFKFDNHTKPWDSHVLPAIRELITQGKIANAPDINNKFVSWRFEQWRSYRKNDVQYWKDRAENERTMGDNEAAQKSASKIQIDERGNEFAEKRYIHILDVFKSQQEALKASDDHYGVEPSSSPVVTNSPSHETMAQSVGDKATALAFLPNFIQMAKDGDKIDLVKLAGLIDDNVILKAHFNLSSPEVQKAIKDAEVPF